MLTYVDWTPGRWGRVRMELLRPCGLPVLYLAARDVPARRVLRTLRRLRRAGDVRCAILPDALAARAAACGIADPDETALRRALLTPLLRALTGEDGARISTVRLSAPSASPAVYAAAEELAHAARRLLLDVGAGQEELGDYLRRRFGLCAGGASPDAEVCFGERKGAAPALFLGPDCRARQRVEYALSAAYAPALGPLPPDGRLLCALFQAKRLPFAAITVKSVQHNA